MAIIDLATAKEHLRVDHNDDDADILQKLEEASAIVVSYLKMPVGTWDLDVIADLNSDGQTGMSTGGESDSGDEAPWEVRAAVKMVLGNLYLIREGGDGHEFRPPNPISQAVIDILVRRRDPSLA